MRYFVRLTCLFSAAYFAVVDMMRKDLQFRTYHARMYVQTYTHAEFRSMYMVRFSHELDHLCKRKFIYYQLFRQSDRKFSVCWMIWIRVRE